jgi:hypothetical protein
MVAPLIVRGLPLALRGAKELASKAKRYGGPGWSAMAALDALTGGYDEKKPQEKKREQSRMGSDANIDKSRIGKGGFEGKPAAKVTKKRDSGINKNIPNDTYGPLTPPRKTVEDDSGILNPSEFGPATMGPMNSSRAAPVMGSSENIDTSKIGRGGFEAEAPRMREGLFGEEIPEDVYQEMERKNKEAGFYGRFKKGGSVKKKPVKKYASGGSVSSASKRADGCATKGKTRGRMV